MENITEAAIEARARRAAKRCGWYLRTSRSRRLSIDDYGKFMIIDPDTNSVVAGKRFDFSAEDVIEFCRQAELQWKAEKEKQKS